MQEDRPKQGLIFSENTKFTFPIIVAFIGLAVWLTKNNFQNEANAQAIQEIKTTQNARDEKLERMATDLAVIKSEVHEIRRKMGR